jgi:hypothetical protein
MPLLYSILKNGSAVFPNDSSIVPFPFLILVPFVFCSIQIVLLAMAAILKMMVLIPIIPVAILLFGKPAIFRYPSFIPFHLYTVSIPIANTAG